MKQFLVKLLIFFTMAFSVDYAVGIIVPNLQAKSKGGTTQKDYYIQHDLDEDLIIMGSSRASHHVIPQQIEDSLKWTAYNAGMDGKGIILNYGLLLEITGRYTPNAIIYEITPSFDYIAGDNEKYLPHLRCAYDIQGVDSIFWEVNPSERYKMMSNLYRANSLVPHLIFDNIIAQPDSLKGYIPLYGIYHPTEITKEVSPEGPEIDILKVDYLKKFINKCKDENIKLIFSISPAYKSNMSNYCFGIELAKEYHIPIIDYRDMENGFLNNELFQDAVHLNHKGATIYTEFLIESIKANDLR